MKAYQGGIIGMIVGFVLMCMAMAFVHLTFDVTVWGESGREGVAVATITSGVVSFLLACAAKDWRSNRRA